MRNPTLRLIRRLPSAYALLSIALLSAPPPSLGQARFVPGEQEISGLFGTRIKGIDRREALQFGGAYRRRVFRRWVAVGEGLVWRKLASAEDLADIDETGDIYYDALLTHGGIERYFPATPSMSPYAGVGFGGFFGTRFDASGDEDIRQSYLTFSGGFRWIPGAESRWGLRGDLRLHKPFSQFLTERTWFSTASVGISLRVW